MTQMRSFAVIGVVMLGVAGLKGIEITEKVSLAGLLEAPAMAADTPVDPAAGGEGASDTTPDYEPIEDEGDPTPSDATDDADAGEDVFSRSDFVVRSGLSREELNVLSRLGERRRALEEREAEIETQARLLEAAEQRIQERVAKLESLQGSIERLLGQLGEAEENEQQRLVSIYEKMKPKAAASIFSQMDRSTLLSVAGRMKNQNLSDILAAMPTDKAVELTTLLASRHGQPETLDEVAAILGESQG
jgi:flagellar motility protein MotE (MotC chaperone)